jgi:hypothetical protein
MGSKVASLQWEDVTRATLFMLSKILAAADIPRIKLISIAVMHEL